MPSRFSAPGPSGSRRQAGITTAGTTTQPRLIMKTRITLIMTLAVAASVLPVRGDDDPEQSEFPKITRQPIDDAIPVGSSTVFAVEANNGDLSYQWLRNGVAIEGETNCVLIIENVGVKDVGLYSCDVGRGKEKVPSRKADLNVYTMSGGGGGPITVFGTPIASSGSQGTCPGAYAGYVNYRKTISQGWGWAPSSGTTIHTATDTNRTDTKVEYVGKYGDVGCNQTSVSVPDPTGSPKYRFTIYFPNNVPTNSYGITLDGFDP